MDRINFHFVIVRTYDSVLLEVNSLNITKACPKTTIPPKLIKDNCDIFASKIHGDFNFSISNSVFPNNLKEADITPVHKKGDRADKSNYRPVSILPALSKFFENCYFIK